MNSRRRPTFLQFPGVEECFQDPLPWSVGNKMEVKRLLAIEEDRFNECDHSSCFFESCAHDGDMNYL